MLPLLYYIIQGLQAKHKTIRADCITPLGMSVKGLIPCIGMNNDDNMVIYVMKDHSFPIVHFEVNEEFADELHLEEDGNVWVLKNVAKQANEDIALIETPDKPIAVDLIQGLLKKGKTVTLWIQGLDFTHGDIINARWDGRGVELHFRDATNDNQVDSLYFTAARFEDFGLQKHGDGWMLESSK